MSKFQVTIVSAEEAAQAIAADEQFGTRQHSKTGDAIIHKIDELKEVWAIVIERLANLAADSNAKTTAALSQYELKSIEFHIGVEGGLSFGLVTKGEAAVSVTFERKDGTDARKSSAGPAPKVG